MALSSSTLDRERDKFSEGDNGETIVNVKPFSVGSLLEGLSFDYIAVAYPNTTTETYTYRNGGASGTIVATITVTYTDATKEQLTSIARS